MHIHAPKVPLQQNPLEPSVLSGASIVKLLRGRSPQGSAAKKACAQSKSKVCSAAYFNQRAVLVQSVHTYGDTIW